MTTDRTQAARPAAPTTDRSAAGPAERSDGSAFAALLDAHATPARGSEPKGRRDDVRERGGDRPPAGPERQDALVRPQDGAPEPAAAEAVKPEAPAVPVPVISGFIPTLTAEAAPVPVAAAPVVPVPVAPVAAPAPAAVLETAPAAPQIAPVAAPAPAAQPANGQPVVQAPVAETAQQVEAETAAATPLPADSAPAELPTLSQQAPAEPVVADATTATPEPETAAPETAAPEAHAPAAAPARATAAEPAAPAAAPVNAPANETAAPAPLSTPLSGAVAPERAAPLHRAPAAVAMLLSVAADRGITRAQLALKPAELGGVEIRLQASAAGITAQVIADSPEAAKLLAQAGDELRRSLESRDVTLISLEVSTTGEWQEQQSARGEWRDGDDADLAHSGRGSDGDAEGDAEPTPTSHSVIELPGGLLVDVLA